MNFLKGRVFRNASWIIVSKLLQSLFAFVISILTARYLGPSNYGVINYAASLVTFVLPIAQLGLNNTLVQELTQKPQCEGAVLGTSIFLSAISAFFCMGGIIAFAAVANFGDVETVWIVAIYSINLLLQVLDLIQYWFQAKLLSKYAAIASLLAYIVVSCYKLYLLVTQKSVYWFAASHAIDYLMIAILLMLFYRKLGGQKLALNFSLGKQMLAKSRHYIVTGLMVAIFSQTDKIMLQSMIGETATGYYAAAVSIASVSSFVYVAIIDSFRPIIFLRQEDEEQFEHTLVQLYSIVIYLSLAQSVIMVLCAELLVGILYGEDFSASASALQVIVWYITFSYIGSIRNIWILAKNKQKYLWIINASGALLNVVLNWLVIPKFGVIGAAATSLVTQAFTNFIIGFIIKPIRANNYLLIKSLNPKYIYGLIKKDESV